MILLLGTCCLLLAARACSYTTHGVSNSCLWNRTFSLRLSRTGSGSAALVVLKPSYPRGLDCKMMIQAPEDSRVLLSYREVDLRWNLDASCLDYIQVEEPMCRRTFELDETQHHASNTPLLTAVVHTNKGGSTLEYRGFTLVATAFTTAGNGSQEDEFQCLNGNIVWSGLTCDGHNNCGDLSDEDPGGSSNCRSRSSAVLVILGVLIIGALVLMCGVTLLCTKNDAVRRFSGRLRARTITFLPTRRPSTR